MMALPWLIGGAVIIAAGAVAAALSDDDNSDSSKSSDSDAQNHKETQREVIKKEAEAFLRSKAEDLGSILQELTESFDIKRMIECSSYNFETITREFDNKYYCVLDFVNQKPAAYQKVINLMNLDKQLLDEFKVLAYAVNKIYGVETLVLTREFKEMEEDLKEIDNERKEIKSLIEKIQQERTEQFMKDIKGLASNILKSIQL